MDFANSALAGTWYAALDLEFARREERTALVARRHEGPLVVQKALYPEGEAVCHAIVVHPPAGIAGGDTLALSARVGANADVVLTTPGAAKWYRSSGLQARQSISFVLGDGACLEWLPQESIVFNGALADMSLEVRLAADACFIGWDILCLGRTGSNERYLDGRCRMQTRLTQGDRPVWFERGSFRGGDRHMQSPLALGGHPVCGTMLAASARLAPDTLAACRSRLPREGLGAVTRLPNVLVARFRGDSTEAAREYFVDLWSVLRPALADRAAIRPRIWRT